jgi:transcription antitermination factor NusA-like protein
VRGEVTRLDVELMKALLETDAPFLQNAEYAGSVKIKNRVFVFFRNLDITLQHLNELSTHLTKKVRIPVRVFRDSRNFNTFLAELLAPSKISAINVVWLPDGSEETVVTVDDLSKLQLYPEEIAGIVSTLKKRSVRIEKAAKR